MWETASRMTEQQQQEIVNTSESRCSFEIESNSRGKNYTTHVYGQCSQQEIDDCIKKTIAAHNKIQGGAQKAQKGDSITNKK